MARTDDGVVIRSATPTDAAFLVLHDHVHADVLAERIRAEQILMLECEGVPVGWLRWSLFWDEIPFMNMLFVVESSRGRGFGTALLDEWESRVRADGHDVVMTSSQADEEAQHLYRHRGYADCGALVLPDQAAELMFRKEL